MSKVIYSSKRSVEMWSLQDSTVGVITFITEHRFLLFRWYRIHQNNPKIHGCTYDGEFGSNRRLQAVRNGERQKAKLWLCEYKSDTNTEKK